MDGLTALGEMVSKHRVPVIMLSSLTTRGAALTMQALEKGAVDFVCKPSTTARLSEMADELVSKIKAAARTNVLALSRAPQVGTPVKKKVRAAGQEGDETESWQSAPHPAVRTHCDTCCPGSRQTWMPAS
jgi:chemotaxis response regulator CheB